jgi:hypothetical protein
MTSSDVHPAAPVGGLRLTLVWLAVLALAAGAVVYPLRRYVVEPQRQALLGQIDPPGRRLALASDFGFETAAGYAAQIVPGQATRDLSDLPAEVATVTLSGFRGPFVVYLWMKAEDDKLKKVHFDVIDRYRQIAVLQSDYPQVWTNMAWNLGWNISVQWQSPEQRYQWIQRASEFLKEGARRNPHSTEICKEMGRIYADKLGHAQEAPFYRQRVKEDTGLSTYLIAYQWYDRGRRNSDRYGFDSHTFSTPVYFSQACHCVTYYATELTQEAYDTLAASQEARKAGRTAEADQKFLTGLEALGPSIDAWKWAHTEWLDQISRFHGDEVSGGLGDAYKRFEREAGEWVKELESAKADLKPDNLPEFLAKIKRPELN